MSMNFTEIKRIVRMTGVMCLFILGCYSAFSQQRTIKGKVMDGTGKPIPGVTIVEKGGTKGGISGADGAFSFSISPETKILVFSFIGMQTQEVDVAKRTYVTVTMKESSVVMDEMVVVGYGTLKKSDATTSISTIKARELGGKPLLSIENTLQGRVAGVLVREDSGEPGAGINVVIRGANSINGSNEPLYVVDGFPVNTGGDASGDAAATRSNPLSFLNPYDIESIDVLKDASATSIYGSRGSNGVVLITTKQAKLGKTKIDFSTQLSLNVADMGYDLLNSYDYASMNNEVARLKYPNLTEEEMLANNLIPYAGEVGSLTPSPENCTVSSDFLDAILRTSFSQNYQLTVSGGTTENSYLVAMGYTSQEGVVLGSDLNKGNIRLNLKNRLFRRFILNTNVALDYTKNSKAAGTGANLQSGPIYNAIRMRPMVPVYSNDGTPVSYDEDGNFVRNPVVEALDKYDQLFSRGGLVNLQGVLDLGKGFKFNTRAGINYRMSSRDIFYPFSTTQGQQLHGQARTNTLTNTFFSTEHFLQYDRVIHKQHRINAVAGISYEYTDKTLRLTEQSNFTFDELGIDALALGNDLSSITSNRTADVLKSGFLRINYSLMDRYIVNFTGRADGSSKFGANNKWGYFPSVSAAWRLGEESFVKKWNIFDELKIRASWGLVGSQAIPSYRTADTYTIGRYFISSTAYTATYASKLPNPDLKWETTETTNLGLDIAVLKNKLNLSADFFVKHTRDLLFERTLPTSSSFATAWVNMGSIRNRGYEFELSAYLLTKKNFSWNIKANFSSVQTVVTDLGGLGKIDGPQLFTSLFTMPGHRIIEGESLGLFYGYECDGLIQIADFEDYYSGNFNPKMVDVTYVNAQGQTVTEKKKSYVPVSANHNTPGQWKFKDQNHDDILSDDDLIRLGKSTPDFTFGFTSNFNYKRWSLSFFLQGAVGFQIMNLTRAVSIGWVGANARTDWYQKRWTVDNQHNDARYPAPGMNDAAGKINSAMIEDGDYVKLQNLTLRYSLPIDKIKFISRCDFYVTGSNLLTITGYSGQDPEVNVLGSNFQTPGVDLGAYPRPRTITFGIDLTF